MSRPSKKSSKPAKSTTARSSRPRPSGFHIVIRDTKWRVVFKPIPEHLWTTKGEKDLGHCDYERRVITVDPWDGDPYWTLFHEIAHATLPDNDETSILWISFVAEKLSDRFPTKKI